MATLYLNLGRDDQAEPLLERALAIDRRTNGEDHPDVAWDLRTLGSLYQRQGRYEEAEAVVLEMSGCGASPSSSRYIASDSRVSSSAFG